MGWIRNAHNMRSGQAMREKLTEKAKLAFYQVPRHSFRN
jgi:hypothetical protein